MTNSNDSALLALEDEFFDQYNAGHLANTEALAARGGAAPRFNPRGGAAKRSGGLRLLPDHWRRVDEHTDDPILLARNLLCELVGGAPGAQLREQFA